MREEAKAEAVSSPRSTIAPHRRACAVRVGSVQLHSVVNTVQCGAPSTTAPEVFSISVAQKGQLVGNNRGNGEIFSQ